MRDLLQDLQFRAGIKPVLRRESPSVDDLSRLAAWFERDGARTAVFPPSGPSAPYGVLYASRDPRALEEARRIHPMSSGPRSCREGARLMGELLGYPSCCAEAYARSDRHEERNGFVRPYRSTRGSPSSLLNTGMPEILLLVPHEPCTLTCEKSIQVARRCEQLIRDADRSIDRIVPIDRGIEILSAPLLWWDLGRWIAFPGATPGARSRSGMEVEYGTARCSLPDEGSWRDIAAALRLGSRLEVEGERLSILDADGGARGFDVPRPLIAIWDDGSWEMTPSPVVGYCRSGGEADRPAGPWQEAHDRLDAAGYFVRPVLVDRLPSPEGQIARLERAGVSIALVSEPPPAGTRLPFLAVWTLSPTPPTAVDGCLVETMPPPDLLIDRLRGIDAAGGRAPCPDLRRMAAEEREEQARWDAERERWEGERDRGEAERDRAGAAPGASLPASEDEIRKLLAPRGGSWAIEGIGREGGAALVRIRSCSGTPVSVVLMVTIRDDGIQAYRRTGSWDVRLLGKEFSRAQYALADAAIEGMALAERSMA